MKERVLKAVILLSISLFISVTGQSQDEPTPLMKAIYLTKSGDYELAQQYCNQAVQSNPTNPHAYYIRGFARYNLGKYRQAIKDFDTTVTLNSKHADAYFYRGTCKKELNKYWSALRDYRKAKEIAPNMTNMNLLKNFFSTLFS